MKFDFRMMMPFDSGRPVAPQNYLQWLFNANGFNNTLIRINENIDFEEFDKFTYITLDGQQIIRYSIEDRETFVRAPYQEGGELIKTLNQMMEFLKSISCHAIVEIPHQCTYNLQKS
jgi:hypothetical protein